MATLPETAVAILPAPAISDFDAVVLGGFQQDDSFFLQAPLLGEAGFAVGPPQADDDAAAAAGGPLQEGRSPTPGDQEAVALDDEATLAYRALASLPMGAADWPAEGYLEAQ